MSFKKSLERFLEGRNPVFALTVRMKGSRRVFPAAACMLVLGLCAVFFFEDTAWPGAMNPGSGRFFELGFLACCGVSMLLGADFGIVFIEATFQDELFRLTPLKPLDFVHGGMLSSFFFSLGLFACTVPFLSFGMCRYDAAGRMIFAVLVLFFAGQVFSTILLSFYIKANRWCDIAPAVVWLAIFFVAAVLFCLTRPGGKLAEPRSWHEPMLFLFVFLTTLLVLAYVLARTHALSPARSFRRVVAINSVCYACSLVAAALVLRMLPH